MTGCKGEEEVSVVLSTGTLVVCCSFVLGDGNCVMLAGAVQYCPLLLRSSTCCLPACLPARSACSLHSRLSSHSAQYQLLPTASTSCRCVSTQSIAPRYLTASWHLIDRSTSSHVRQQVDCQQHRPDVMRPSTTSSTPPYVTLSSDSHAVAVDVSSRPNCPTQRSHCLR